MCNPRFLFYCLVGFSLAMSLSPAQAPAVVTANLDPMPAVFALGASIPVAFTVRNDSPAPLPLPADGWGSPGGLLEVLDATGSPVKPALVPGDLGGPPGPLRADQVYTLAPGQALRLQADLTGLVSLTEPGAYAVRVTTEGRVLGEAKFALVKPDVIQQRKVTGRVPEPAVAPQNSRAEVSLRLSVIDVRVGGARSRFLRVDELAASGRPVELPACVTPVPAAAEFLDARLDYLGQLWVIVQDGRQRSLMTWTVADKQFRTLVAPADQKVELASAVAFRYQEDLSFVVGGAEGKTKFTTSSLSDPMMATDVRIPNAGR